MSKVLLAFLGTGENGERGYRSVTYRFDEEASISNTFVSEAIKEKCDIDRTIMVGTKGSIWEEYYKYCNEDDDFCAELLKACQSYNNGNTEIEFPKDWEQKIEAIMGVGSKVVIIEKGIDAKEQKWNVEQLLKAVTELKDGDELYIDITHSFRSLPMYLMNCLIFLRTVRPNVKIKKILYAMMEDPYGQEAKIIDMTSVLDIYDWISGANAFINYGNSYEICKKLNEANRKDISDKLKEFSNASNVNINLPNIAVDFINIEETGNTMVDMILAPIKDSIEETFGEYESDSSDLYKLACWHYNHKNYLASLDALKEAILEKIFEKEKYFNGADKKTKAEEITKEIIKMAKGENVNAEYMSYTLACTYREMNRIRNNAAHQTQELDIRTINIEEKLDTYLNRFKNFIFPQQSK